MYIIIKSAKTIKNGSEKLSASCVINADKVFSFKVTSLYEGYDVVAKTDTAIQTIHRFRTVIEARELIGAIYEAMSKNRDSFDVEAYLEAVNRPDNGRPRDKYSGGYTDF